MQSIFWRSFTINGVFRLNYYNQQIAIIVPVNLYHYLRYQQSNLLEFIGFEITKVQT
jgi:hypothetical protein